MNPNILDRIKIRNFQYNLKRFIYIQYNVDNNSNKYNIIKCHKNKNDMSYFGSSKYASNKQLCQISAPIYATFQRRNLSNEASAQFESGDLSKSSLTDLPSEGIKNMPMDNLPQLFTTFSESKIVEIAQSTLLKMHEVTGLPWWASIALTAFIMRTTITLPFSLIQMHNTGKLLALKPEMDEIVEDCKKKASYAVTHHGWPESLARKQYKKDIRTEWNKLVVRDNCHPFKSFIIVLIQLPVWFSYSFATRNLSYMLPKGDPSAELTYLEMMVGGFGWVKNLTDIDHYMILPLTCTLINLAIIEANILFKDQTTLTKLQKLQLYIFRGVSLIMFPIALYVPSGTLIYWISSSSFGLLQAFLFQSTRLQRLVGMPMLDSQPKHPYRLFYSNLKSRLHLTGKRVEKEGGRVKSVQPRSN